MEIIKNNNGFPYSWKAGRVEQLIRSLLENKARQQLNVNRVMIINPTWLHEANILEHIRQVNPDFIICHNFVDPVVLSIFDSIEKSGVPYIILGNSKQFRIDFWAMVCDLYFQDYEANELLVQSTARKYICLNRKPHPHRITLVEELQKANVFTQGYVSLGLPGDAAITVDTEFTEEQGISDEYSTLDKDEAFVSHKIRNDIFSLGDMQVWNNSYLCLVTETEFANTDPDNFFTSEKTFKPIIGMRPFFVYGQPHLRQYLKDEGFDIFEDIFNYSLLPAEMPEYSHAQQLLYAKVAVDAINRVVDPQWSYRRLLPRLKQNKQQFHSYVYKQWDKLNNLDLRDYV